MTRTKVRSEINAKLMRLSVVRPHEQLRSSFRERVIRQGLRAMSPVSYDETETAAYLVTQAAVKKTLAEPAWKTLRFFASHSTATIFLFWFAKKKRDDRTGSAAWQKPEEKSVEKDLSHYFMKGNRPRMSHYGQGSPTQKAAYICAGRPSFTPKFHFVMRQRAMSFSNHLKSTSYDFQAADESLSQSG